MKILLDAVKEIADKNYGGHFSIYHFSTNVKGCFGTIEDHGDSKRSIREFLADMPAFNSLDELFVAMIQNPEKMDAYNIPVGAEHNG